MKKLTAKIIPSNNDIEPIIIYHNISSVEFDSLDRGDITDRINYGIYSNIGTLIFFDDDNQFYNLMKIQEPYGYKVEIYLSSELYDRLIATFHIDEFSYNEETKQVAVQLKDSLESWQNIPISKIYLFEETSLIDLVAEIMSQKKIAYKISNEASYLLEDIIIYCPLLEPESLWDAMTKICEASMCRICEDETGTPIIVNQFEASKQNITIRPQNVLGVSNQTSSHKNKDTAFSISLKKREKHYGSVINAPYFYMYKVDYNKDNGSLNWRYIGDDKSQNPTAKVERNWQAGSEDTWGKVYPYIETVSINTRLPLIENVFDITERKFIGTHYYQYVSDGYQEHGEELDAPVQVAGDTTMWEKWSNTLITRFTVFPSIIAEKYDQPQSSELDIYSNVTMLAYGDYFVDNKNVIIASTSNNNSRVTTLPSNELFQTNNLHGNESYSSWFIERTQKITESSVAFCEIECNFTNYYNSDGELVLDASGKEQPIQSFSKYDIVIPYIMKNGIEQPYRSNSDGEPVSFRVVGIKYVYDGHLRQKLYLQEETIYKNN